MYLVYLGESGNTGNSINDPNQPHHVHVGLLVHETQSVSINGEFNALYRRHFGGPRGENGTPNEIRPAHVFQGLGFFKSWPPAKRGELIQDCLSILIRRETPVIVAHVNKQEFAQARSNHDNPNQAVFSAAAKIMVISFIHRNLNSVAIQKIKLRNLTSNSPTLLAA